MLCLNFVTERKNLLCRSTCLQPGVQTRRMGIAIKSEVSDYWQCPNDCLAAQYNMDSIRDYRAAD